jgi:hypothetical protein
MFWSKEEFTKETKLKIKRKGHLFLGVLNNVKLAINVVV